MITHPGCPGKLDKDIHQLHSLDLSDDGGLWTHNRDIHKLAQVPGKLICCPVNNFPALMPQVDPKEPGIWRIMKCLAVLHLAHIHGMVITLMDMLYDRMRGIGCLNDDLPLAVFPACPSGHLGHQLVAPFK